MEVTPSPKLSGTQIVKCFSHLIPSTLDAALVRNTEHSYMSCSRQSKASDRVSHNSHTNYRFLSSAEKDERLHYLQRAKVVERKTFVR